MNAVDPTEFIVGIDPGLTGAIAFFAKDQPYSVVDLPTVQRNKTGNAQKINNAQLADILSAQPIAHVYLELVKGMPRMAGGKSVMGATSAFNFGRTFGALEQALASAKIPYTLVPPEVWKKRAGLIGAEKEASRTRALQLWPKFADQMARKKDVGRAEALLIAHYGSGMMERAEQLERKDPFGSQGGRYE